MRKEVRFKDDDGDELSAWLYLPDDGVTPRPAISMAHGFAATRWHGLGRFAEAFVAAGFVVLVHDHRTFGLSTGKPRQDINPWRQIEGWRRAISYLEALPQVDPRRIGIWGSSFAGGHVLVLGATDSRVACVVAQVPTINGYQQGLRRVLPEGVARLEAAFSDDERARARGEPARTQMVASADPESRAAYRTEEAANFYLQPLGEGAVWENTVTVQSSRWARMYEPGLWVPRISPTPLLMVVATHDTVAVTDLALEAYERAHEPKKLVMIPGGHFDPYSKRFDIACPAALGWFRQHLMA
jgi:fermentation-respiration switch protein FrsA (DUF1100 family)